MYHHILWFHQFVCDSTFEQFVHAKCGHCILGHGFIRLLELFQWHVESILEQKTNPFEVDWFERFRIFIFVSLLFSHPGWGPALAELKPASVTEVGKGTWDCYADLARLRGVQYYTCEWTTSRRRVCQVKVNRVYQFGKVQTRFETYRTNNPLLIDLLKYHLIQNLHLKLGQNELIQNNSSRTIFRFFTFKLIEDLW
jgi:hypothetical protein